MRFAQIFTVASMAMGAMAGCQRANVCKGDVRAEQGGFNEGWACSGADDLPCTTTCITVGSRQAPSGPGMDTIKCCKPGPDC
ncbi:uncharacterized protein CTRU02_205844 [Colletotrichum truncatum]|uniref:Uncharacterized protein n=1 Tax=Colletotrichum truncatum TaxID=5467 RepID=A0ACC3Z577_COLTU